MRAGDEDAWLPQHILINVFETKAALHTDTVFVAGDEDAEQAEGWDLVQRPEEFGRSQAPADSYMEASVAAVPQTCPPMLSRPSTHPIMLFVCLG